MIKQNVFFSLALFLIFGMNVAYAEKQLNANEVKALFTDVTFDAFHELKEKETTVYSGPDGKQTVLRADGETKQRKWFVDESGRHCIEGRRLRCATVIDMGDGVYHKIMNKVHVLTLSHFRKGKHL
jgi:hypothetical protein